MKRVARSCIDCVFHTMPAELGGQFHLCTLPPDCAPPAAHDDDEDGFDREAEGRVYLGTSCDVMRRKGAACGPHAAMWRSVNHAHRSAAALEGGEA